MDHKYTVAAIRRTWDVIAGRVFEEANKNRLTAREVRRHVEDYIDGEGNGSASARSFWDTLSDEDRRRILAQAFPQDDYIRPEKRTVFISAPPSMDTKGLRDTFRERGFDPVTIDSVAAVGQSLAELIGECIDKAEWVLIVFHHGRNPNVMIELGYAMAKKKRIIALVPPDGEAPVADVPYLRTALDNKEAIGFWLDQVLTAPKGKAKPRKGDLKKTKPLGSAADDLLQELRAAQGRISEARFAAIVRRAIEGSGVSTVVSEPGFADRGVDFAVWSEDVEPQIKNPVVIELKTRLRGKLQFKRAIAQLSKALDSTGTQVGLLIYAEGHLTIDEDALFDPRVCVFSLEEFLSGLKQRGFADLLRRARNMRVHSVMT
jgi:hypothetical protein